MSSGRRSQEICLLAQNYMSKKEKFFWIKEHQLVKSADCSFHEEEMLYRRSHHLPTEVWRPRPEKPVYKIEITANGTPTIKKLTKRPKRVVSPSSSPLNEALKDLKDFFAEEAISTIKEDLEKIKSKYNNSYDAVDLKFKRMGGQLMVNIFGDVTPTKYSMLTQNMLTPTTRNTMKKLKKYASCNCNQNCGKTCQSCTEIILTYDIEQAVLDGHQLKLKSNLPMNAINIAKKIWVFSCYCRKCAHLYNFNSAKTFVFMEPFQEMGYALRAFDAISEGTVLGEYLGDVYDGEIEYFRDEAYTYKVGVNIPLNTIVNQADIKQENDLIVEKQANGKFIPLREFGIDSSSSGNKFRYLSHSCNPNARIVELHTHGANFIHSYYRLLVVTRRNIKPGERLSIDYDFGSATVRNVNSSECRCMETTCKGFYNQ